MRILMVSHYFESHRGGIEIVAGRLASELAVAGHDVVWAAADASPPPSRGLFNVEPLRAWNFIEGFTGLPMPLLAPSALSRLAAEVRRADAVIVHDALYVSSLAALFAARRYGTPSLLVQHVGHIPYRNPLLRGAMHLATKNWVVPALLRADQVVFISETVRRYFGSLRFNRPPLTRFNGVDEGFRPTARDERDALRREFDIPEGRRTALFAGRFVEKKGLAHIREAARLRPETLFLLAGWGPIAPSAWQLPNVRVLADLAGPALARVYRAADLLVLPSVGEGLPLVLQEALASGLPVICGSETASADPEATQWLIPLEVDPADAPGTGQRLADAIKAAPRYDALEAQRRSAFAHARYSWQRTARLYAAELATLAFGAHGAGTRQLEAA